MNIKNGENYSLRFFIAEYNMQAKLALGLDHDGHHLSGHDTGVQTAALGALAKMDRVASLQNVLLFNIVVIIQGNGHFAGNDVINHLKVCGSNISAAAGKKMAQAVYDGAFVHFCGVVKTGGTDVKMAGSFILGGLVGTSNFVRHGNTSFQIKIMA